MFQVQRKYKSSRWDVLAERKTREEADQLYGKLRAEYGPEWMLMVVDKGNEKPGWTGSDFMLRFASDLSGSNVSAEQLRCLWTSWCLMYDMNTDTLEYDALLRKLWDDVPASAKERWEREAELDMEEGTVHTAYDDGYVDGLDMFDRFMGVYLC